RRGLFSHRYARGLRRAIGDPCQHRVVGVIDGRLLRRHELRERGVIRRRNRGLDRGTRRCLQLQLTGWVALGDGVHSFVHGRPDDRQYPVGGGVPSLASTTISPALMFQSVTTSASALGAASNEAATTSAAIC